MNAVLSGLVELNLAAAAAILLVLAVRRPAARFLGPHAAYGLWAMVPVAMLATLLPERTTETVVGEFLVGGLPASLAAIEASAGASWLAPLLAAVWIAGAGILAALLVRSQRTFLRDAEIGLAGPAIVGFRHPRIVTPDDFSRRFSHDERKLILAHEQVHIDRSDARINAFAALLRCLFWFNPLIHVGAKAMRIDQELSCDAEVIDRRPRVRRAYAETLLKTQLASRPLPVGCYWPAEAQHPLAERIALIAKKPLSFRRRALASVLVIGLTGAAGLGAWAAQPERTVFRETADVILPFEPIPVGQRADVATTRPRLIPGSFRPPAVTDLHYPSDSALAAELCVSASGAVESVTLVQSSGDKRLDEATVHSLREAQFEPAADDSGKSVAVCGQQMTIEFKTAPDTSPP